MNHANHFAADLSVIAMFIKNMPKQTKLRAKTC